MNKAVTKATSNLPDLPAGLDMEADAAEHRQDFRQDMLIIPRLQILQDLSPEIKETKAEYVKGAKPGLILNQINRALDTEIIFTPARFAVRYIAWRPRSSGGGLVDPNLTLEEVEQNFEQSGIGVWTGVIQVKVKGEIDAVRVEVKETPEWVGIAKGKTWGPMPVAISFPSTKVKSAKAINTAISLTEVEGKNGPFRPPAFYHQFKLKTGLEQRGDDEWYGFVVEHQGYGLDPDMIKRAKDLKIAFDEDRATVDDSALDG